MQPTSNTTSSEKRLLIVDDEPDLLVMLKDAFEYSGYSVKVAEDGLVALKVLETFSPDLIISDARMPGMTGFELVNYVKKTSPKLPCVLISGYAEGLEKRAYAAGVEALFMKPFRLVDLIQFVHTITGDLDSRPKRASIRVACSVELLTHFGAAEIVRASTLNLSEGGLFVVIPNEKMPLNGELVKFEVFPDGSNSPGIKGQGYCRWIRERDRVAAPRGFGLRFENPQRDLVDAMKELVDSHQIKEVEWLK